MGFEGADETPVIRDQLNRGETQSRAFLLGELAVVCLFFHLHLCSR